MLADEVRSVSLVAKSQVSCVIVWQGSYVPLRAVKVVKWNEDGNNATS